MKSKQRHSDVWHIPRPDSGDNDIAVPVDGQRPGAVVTLVGQEPGGKPLGRFKKARLPRLFVKKRERAQFVGGDVGVEVVIVDQVEAAVLRLQG